MVTDIPPIHSQGTEFTYTRAKTFAATGFDDISQTSGEAILADYYYQYHGPVTGDPLQESNKDDRAASMVGTAVGVRHEEVYAKHQTLEEDKTTSPSPAFINLILRRKINVMLSRLDQIQDKLGKPESAPFVVALKETLADVWENIDHIPESQALLLSSAEGVIRGERWLNLKRSHIQVLRSTLQNAKKRDIDMQETARMFKQIHKSGMDVFPSSSIDEDELDEEG